MRVLFLCTGNYYRSRLAEELLRYTAERADLRIEVDSAGLGRIPNPANPGPIGLPALNYLQTLGISSPSLSRYPKKFTFSDLQAADVVVCMNEPEHRGVFERQARPFPCPEKTSYWHVPDVEEDPELMGPKLIHREVSGLLAALARQQAAQDRRL